MDAHTPYHVLFSALPVSAFVMLREKPTLPDFLFIGGFVLGGGFMKECYDQSVGGSFSHADILADVVGIGFGIALGRSF